MPFLSIFYLILSFFIFLLPANSLVTTCTQWRFAQNKMQKCFSVEKIYTVQLSTKLILKIIYVLSMYETHIREK